MRHGNFIRKSGAGNSPGTIVGEVLNDSNCLSNRREEQKETEKTAAAGRSAELHSTRLSAAARAVPRQAAHIEVL
eukprot:522831-Hanusia_phi.AAC.1